MSKRFEKAKKLLHGDLAMEERTELLGIAFAGLSTNMAFVTAMEVAASLAAAQGLDEEQFLKVAKTYFEKAAPARAKAERIVGDYGDRSKCNCSAAMGARTVHTVGGVQVCDECKLPLAVQGT